MHEKNAQATKKTDAREVRARRAAFPLVAFLWDKTLAISFNVIGIIAVSVFVGFVAGLFPALIVAAAWTVLLAAYLAVSYALLVRRVAALKDKVARAESKLYLSEAIPPPLQIGDRLYYELMLMQGKAAIERVTVIESEKAEYYDYLQNWVHEIKTPLAAASLICSNNRGDGFDGIAAQLARISDGVEQIFCEARTYSIGNDILIKSTDLAALAGGCIRENKQIFIDGGVSITADASGTVFTDGRWLTFILKQILVNSWQYRAADSPAITLRSEAADDKIILYVTDNGIGIPSAELPRVFEKGFTGSNGRANKKSTGLGLYLCKKLCDALDIGIEITSCRNEFTTVALTLNGKQ